ncbi:hypothetical protein RUM44_003152 [Polyplax serrata]|uniref:HP domain-containing protein n=1 Tax=Polyplax serrata TaxID=468196 RepID=A0ABR1AXR1_POLSC
MTDFLSSLISSRSSEAEKSEDSDDCLYDGHEATVPQVQGYPLVYRDHYTFLSSNNSSIVKSQSHSAVPSTTDSFNLLRRDNPDEVDEPRSRKGPGELSTSTTQPFKTTDTSNDNDMSGASIQERLARLKKNGELSWQKRKSHVINVEDEISVITTGNYLLKESLLRSSVESPKSRIDLPKPGGELRSSILSDRLEQLGAAQSGWKKRVQPSDAVRFSVEGMLLENSEVSPAASAIPAAVARKKRSPKALKFRSRYAVDKSPSVEQSEELCKKIESEKHAASISETTEEIGPVVTVPKIDDETFTSFFNGALDLREKWNERLELRDEDLDVIAKMKSSQLLVQKRNIKTQRRRATVQNPVKALSTRFQFQEYTEIKTGAAQKELRRLRLESPGETNSNLAIEALAGLASQEDFTAVTLKKASEGGTQSPDAPYKDLMLLQIKGRRHIQTRLVEPVASSINIGDCFVLVTGNKVFHYVGKYANVIERSRGAEIAISIQQRGDLGCTAESVVTIGESGRATKKETEEFWTLLGGRPENERGAGSLDEDEIFESCLVDTNKVYQVVDQEMVPVDSYWGAIPKIDVLDPNKVMGDTGSISSSADTVIGDCSRFIFTPSILVFDFGSELYVWNGKNVNLTDRKEALKLAREFWDEGYDYSECSLCPITVATYMGSPVGSEVPDCTKSGPNRPSWALFAKITQNMETVLFREKFLDWPDYSRVIQKNKKNESTACDGNGITDLKPCDAKEMLENSVPEPDMVLEGSHLGRGVTYYDEETRRCSEITTQEVIVWHISEYEHTEIPATSVGQFHMGDSYVVRWHYTVTITGRELGGQPSKHITTGRDRYAYFCWQGQDSPINDKGAAACLTVELDKENGPQVRVVQGFEPPVFLNLFKGTMVVHRGKRFLNDEYPTWRLYICRGEVETESVLFEVPCSMRQLRSVASFLLVNNRKGMLIVWHGYHSCEHSRKVILSAVRQIQKNKPLEFGFSSQSIEVREEVEGRESSELLGILGADNRQLYWSFLSNETFKVTTPRLFHLTSISGQFQSMELASPYLNKEVTTPLPFVQADLYSASQPALFLLDTGTCLWLWQGWKDDSLETDRGSGNHRFQAERRAAMSTALDYWAHKYGTSGTIRAYLIWAGLEPLVFTNQFPFWTDRDDVAEINMKDGKKPGEIVQVEKELESLTQCFYNLSELQNRPLPDGVNPSLLEDYLKPECFQEVFGLDRNDFFTLPSWKKKKLKQEAGLF